MNESFSIYTYWTSKKYANVLSIFRKNRAKTKMSGRKFRICFVEIKIKKFHVVQRRQKRGKRHKRKYMMMWHPLFLLFALDSHATAFNQFPVMLPDKFFYIYRSAPSSLSCYCACSCGEKEWHFNRNRIILSFTIFYSSSKLSWSPKIHFSLILLA